MTVTMFQNMVLSGCENDKYSMKQISRFKFVSKY